ARQAVPRVVGDAHGVVLVGVGDDAEDRAEDLLAGHPHGVVDVAEDGRHHVPPLGQPGWTLAARHHPCALLDGRADVALDPVPLPAGHEGADDGDGVVGVGAGDGTAALAGASSASAYCARGTSTRVCAPQTCPDWCMPPLTTRWITVARSASSRTMAADFPPSSSETRFTCSPQSWMIRRPAAVDPVNATLSVPGWVTRCSPTARSPGTTQQLSGPAEDV